MALDVISRLEKLQALRGMVDLLPKETPLWQWVESAARDHFKRAAIKEIRTPILETTKLFARGIGESTDVVGKEMYSFLDQGERNCTLRPEGTASVVRAAIQNGLLNQGPQRLWYSGPMFRYERPQAGRQRQFHQIGVEYLGFDDPRSDVETISIAWDFLCDLGLSGLALEINSLGNSEDRATYRKVLVSWLEERQNHLDKTSQERLHKNPLRILDSKDPGTKKLLLDAPLLKDVLTPESQERFERVQSAMNALKIPFHLNPRLVRGLDYYSHTAFEITSEELGAQATVCGGGRYDGLVEQLGGTSTPSIGWALGMERLILLLSKKHFETSGMENKLYIVSKGEKAEALALLLSRTLRNHQINVELDLSGSAFNKQLKRANRSNFRWVVLIGDNEAEKGEFILKDLKGLHEDDPKEELMRLEALLERFA